MAVIRDAVVRSARAAVVKEADAPLSRSRTALVSYEVDSAHLAGVLAALAPYDYDASGRWA